MISHTIMQRIKSLFFKESVRRWHFKDIIIESGLSRERVNFFLKQLLNEKLIKRIKPKGKMPYYLANRKTESFRSKKRLFGLNLLEKSGLYNEILSIKEIKTAILFGSFSRGDWNNSSDIDLFIFGNCDKLEKGKIELKLKKQIQLFNYNNLTDIKKELDSNLIPNIIKGFNIKGDLEPFKVIING